MPPQVAVGGFTPRPMNDSDASVRTAVAIQSEPITSTSLRMFGSTCTNRMRVWEKPSARPASMKARSFRLSTGARAMRANGAMAVSAIANTRLIRSGPEQRHDDQAEDQAWEATAARPSSA